MADSISAIPQQPFLGRLAEFLRFLEKDRPEFLPRQLGVMQGMSQLALPQASTIENLSYGNQPFTMPPSGTGAMIPQVKTGRKAEVADLIGMISGVPGAGAVADVGTKLSNQAADALVRAITRNPQATAPGVLQETAMPFMQAVAPKMPSLLDQTIQKTTEDPLQKAFRTVNPGDKVSGLTVRKDIPNMGSINATLDNYEILDGIRNVPSKAFDKEYLDSLRAQGLDKRTADLSEQIKKSKEINPLIVAVDNKGAYIIEGGHRFDALMTQKRISVPAKVVIDKDNPPTKEFLQSLFE